MFSVVSWTVAFVLFWALITSTLVALPLACRLCANGGPLLLWGPRLQVAPLDAQDGKAD
jgi:hypothetical protein